MVPPRGVKIGCCGWPVAQRAYFERFGAIEINSTFYNPPRMVTADRWRKEAPPEFEFSVKAWQLITHPSSSQSYEKLTEKMNEKSLARCGGFKDTQEVGLAWERTLGVAKLLKAKFILFQTPHGFYPSANHMRDMYRFFKASKRGDITLVWEPRGEAWTATLIDRVCKDLGLVHGVDPSVGTSVRGAVHYFRLHGKHAEGRIQYNHSFSDAELKSLLARCEGRPAYVFFNNLSMWQDAQRFQELTSQSHVRNLRHL